MAEQFEGIVQMMSASVRHYFQTVLTPEVAPAVLFGAAVIALLGILFLLLQRRSSQSANSTGYEPGSGEADRVEKIVVDLQKRINAMMEKGNGVQQDVAEVREALRAFGESYREKNRLAAEHFAHLSNELRGIKLVLKGIVRSSLERYTAEIRANSPEEEDEEEEIPQLQASAGARNSGAVRNSGAIRNSSAIRASGVTRIAKPAEQPAKAAADPTNRRVVLERAGKRSTNEVFFKE